jgi:hypothetical protein
MIQNSKLITNDTKRTNYANKTGNFILRAIRPFVKFVLKKIELK